MNVAMMQPSFVPWQGLFEMILKSNIFIFLDDFQLSVQSYHQRNRLFVNKGRTDWYTVPVLKSVSFKCPLNQTKINESEPWRKKMWKRLEFNYSKAPYYNETAPAIEKWLMKHYESLAEQNIAFIMIVCNSLGIKKEFRLSSKFYSPKKSSERVIELLNWCSADLYYCAKGSFAYMREEGVFPVDGIKVMFQDYKPRPYYQIGSPDHFIPFLSVLDALMNIGAKNTLKLIEGGSEKWLTWDDMVEDYP